VKSLDLIGRRVAVWHGSVTALDPRWTAHLGRAGLDPASDWSALAPGEAVSTSDITNCFRVGFADGETAFFKRYVYPRPSLRYFLRPSRAAMEVFGYRELARLGIPTVKVLGFREIRRFGLLQAAFVITRGIPGAVDLRRYARETWWHLLREERRRIYDRIRVRIFEDLRRIHRARFFHQDLHWRNILVNPEQLDTEPPVWIDCPRAAYRPWARRHGELVDLSCLSRGALTFLTPGQRLRALKEYLGAERAAEVRALYRAIAGHHRRSRHPPRVEKLPPRDEIADRR